MIFANKLYVYVLRRSIWFLQ